MGWAKRLLSAYLTARVAVVVVSVPGWMVETAFNAREVAKLLVGRDDVSDRTVFWVVLSRTTSTAVLKKYAVRHPLRRGHR
jgi:hypothetical protein